MQFEGDKLVDQRFVIHLHFELEIRFRWKSQERNVHVIAEFVIDLDAIGSLREPC